MPASKSCQIRQIGKELRETNKLEVSKLPQKICVRNLYNCFAGGQRRRILTKALCVFSVRAQKSQQHNARTVVAELDYRSESSIGCVNRKYFFSLKDTNVL